MAARLGAFLLCAALSSAPARAHAPPASGIKHDAKLLKLEHAHRRASLSVQLIDAQGKVKHSALRELREYLACHKTGKKHPIHWRLAVMLLSIARHWPQHRLVVHSGYRDPKVSFHARRSNHTRGRAVDIRIPGVPNRLLFSTLRRSFERIGVGYYPNSSFVHLDVRDKSAIWVDYAGPGQSACYSPTPRQDLESGTAEILSLAAARRRGCR